MAQRPRRGIPGIGKGLLSLVHKTLIQRVELAFSHKDLSPHFHALRRRLAVLRLDRNAKRNAVHGPDVMRDIFPDGPVAPSGRDRECAVLIGQRDRDAVDLELRHHGRFHLPKLIGQAALAPLVPFPQLRAVEGVGEGKKRLRVLVLLKIVDRRPSDPLGGRVRGLRLWEFCLQIIQGAIEPVILRIRDHGIVLDVIPVIVAPDH